MPPLPKHCHHPRQIRSGDVAICRLEDHVACFCRTSGTTHILDALSGELLAWLVTQENEVSVGDAEKHFAHLLSVSETEMSSSIASALQLLIGEQLVVPDQ